MVDVAICPYCGVSRPFMKAVTEGFQTADYRNDSPRTWQCFACTSCGGVVLESMWLGQMGHLSKATIVPESAVIDEAIPERPREYLLQAQKSGAAPSGAVMLAASAVDAMLKAKGLKKGTLYERINQAAANHLITEGMADWAHSVRLDANSERHADEKDDLPTVDDSRQVLEFAMALAQFLFVLPDRVEKGRSASTHNPS